MNEREIFAEALLRTDATDRAAFLDKACAADVALRRRIEELLALHEQDRLLLDRLPLERLSEGKEILNLKEAEAPTPEAAAALLAVYLSPSDRPGALGRLAHYDILEVLGQGGYGIVVKAFDESLHRIVAIKVLAPHLATTSPARKRFLREARAAAQVKHENVVQIYAVEEQPLPYLVMEFVEGLTLQQRLDGSGPLDAAEIVRLGQQIARGLAAAHDKGLIHRDVKPTNILLETGIETRAKLTDFGLARARDDASMTQSGVVAGTPMFMAPEQAKGADLDNRADLFSFGSVLYTMVTGHPPFRAPHTLAVLRRVAEDTPRSIREIIPETPQWLCDIILKLLAKNPDDRFQSAREVADLLADCEAKLRLKLDVKNVLPVTSRPHGRQWGAAVVVVLLPLIALAVTEFAGLTHVFREAPDNIQPGSDPALLVAAKKETAVPAALKEPPSDAKSLVELSTPVPTVHESWLKAIALLPIEEQVAALPAKLKERLPDFDAAFVRVMPAVRADRQVVMAEAWLKERKPAFAGFEDAWCKAIPALSGDAQLILVTAWLRERNPGVDDAIAHKIEDGKLTTLEVPSRLMQDLMPLRTLTAMRTLTGRSTLGYDNHAARDAVVLRSLKSLETINGKAAAQFWKDVEAKQAEFKEWLQLVPTLTAVQQAAVVAAKVKERNPGYEGEVRHKIEDNIVTELNIDGKDLTDLSPVRALMGLKALSCTNGPLTDLSPLQGMQLISLNISSCKVRDFEPLKGIKLEHLHAQRFLGSDLTPLQGMPLKSLSLGFALSVTDLKPLQGMPLEHLAIQQLPLSDLTPLQGMPLKSLDLAFGRQVTDLKALQGMPLEYLNLSQQPVSDLTALKDMTSLRWFILQENTTVSDLSPLRGLPLQKLHLRDSSKILDLTPLGKIPIEELEIQGTSVTNLEPLKDLPLKRLECDFQPDRDGKILRAITTLERINGKPAAEFWKDIQAR